MSTFNPTPQQKEAIDYDKSVVITACPGSGKTTVMKEKIRAITPHLSSHKGVIAITFTKKASEELKKRCKENAHDTKFSFFGTIDSFCLNELILPFLGRVWGGKTSECQVVKMLDSDQKALLSQQYNSPTLNELISDNGFKELYDKGVLWMSSFAALSNLILRKSASARRYIKARYTHVFIDEYQDSSEAQHTLFIDLFNLGLVANAVGDVDQSIYRFRGSQPKFLIDLTNNSTNFKHIELDVNHRCHPSIVNYASRVIDPDFPLLQHAGGTRVYRRVLEGNLKNAAQTINSWISDWLQKGKFSRASDIAVLAKKEKSLKEFSSGLELEHRLYIDTPLNNIASECADIYSDILYYKHGAIPTAQEIIDKYSHKLIDQSVVDLRRVLKAIRAEQDLEAFISRCEHFLTLMKISETEAENDAVRVIWNSDSLVRLFRPLADQEVQLMTLHKSKGLEFKLVFHLDLEEWSFPYRIPGKNRNDINYPSLEEDTNLHYVGITRAEQSCILIQTKLRRNSQDGFSDSYPSYFLLLPQLEGLYK